MPTIICLLSCKYSYLMWNCVSWTVNCPLVLHILTQLMTYLKYWKTLKTPMRSSTLICLTYPSLTFVMILEHLPHCPTHLGLIFMMILEEPPLGVQYWFPLPRMVLANLWTHQSQSYQWWVRVRALLTVLDALVNFPLQFAFSWPPAQYHILDQTPPWIYFQHSWLHLQQG